MPHPDPEIRALCDLTRGASFFALPDGELLAHKPGGAAPKDWPVEAFAPMAGAGGAGAAPVSVFGPIPQVALPLRAAEAMALAEHWSEAKALSLINKHHVRLNGEWLKADRPIESADLLHGRFVVFTVPTGGHRVVEVI